jgi:hypothetical protein
MTEIGAAAIDSRRLVGFHDMLMMTLDTLRYDVAAAALESGQTPNLARLCRQHACSIQSARVDRDG